MDSKNTNPLLTLPSAIVIAGTLIAIAVIWTKRTPPVAPMVATPSLPAQVAMAPITSTDHILGNPNADVKIVEYSDPSCPYCKMFNPVMEQIMNAYGPSGKVAWIYRHFPLDKPDSNGNVLHKNAGHEAMGLECAASIGGNDKFWAYEKEWYDIFPDNGQNQPITADNALMLKVAKDSGITTAAFSDCVSSGQFKTKIDQEYLDGVNAGITGTPYSVLITPSGTKIPLVGSQDYSTLKQTIDVLLSPPQSQ